MYNFTTGLAGSLLFGTNVFNLHSELVDCIKDCELASVETCFVHSLFNIRETERQEADMISFEWFSLAFFLVWFAGTTINRGDTSRCTCTCVMNWTTTRYLSLDFCGVRPLVYERGFAAGMPIYRYRNAKVCRVWNVINYCRIMKGYFVVALVSLRFGAQSVQWSIAEDWRK